MADSIIKDQAKYAKEHQGDDTKPDPAGPRIGDSRPAPERPEETLSESGKRALEAERVARKEAEEALTAGNPTARELAAERKKRNAAERELHMFRQASMTETEKAIAAAKLEGRNEVLASANERLVRAEVKALAGAKLADPEDAVRLLNLSDFEVGDSGEVDGKAIASAIDGLIASKPYLAATARNTGSIHSGPQSNDGGTTDNPDAWLRAQAQR